MVPAPYSRVLHDIALHCSMKFKLLYIALALLANHVLFAQEGVDLDEMVGFACYYGGTPSKTVQKVTRKLHNGNYKAIASMLSSKNSAERYMAVITLEKLAESGKFDITPKQHILIDQVKNDTQLVSICSGCTLFQKIELKDMFSEQMHLFAKNWMNSNFDK